MIDIEFNVFSDTPNGKDPDSFSPTLRNYHQKLWSKRLPNGTYFYLDLDTPRLLHHQSELGEFFLSSDAIGHTYKGVRKMSHIVDKLPIEELDIFFNLCSTIGGFIIFPARRIKRKMTINGARGTNHKIQDRFDLTLECIKRFYQGEESPLSETFNRYSTFFELFEDFEGYTKFFLLEDLVTDNFKEIKFWHPFSSFTDSPMPQDFAEYLEFKRCVETFITKRNHRITKFSSSLTNGNKR